jgi:pyrimidine-specific ribonucleoside hydrolase
MAPTPFLIDTDMAIDDWMAIAYLLQCPSVSVRAITVTGTGEAHARPGLGNALRLAAFSKAEQIDVAHGRAAPLRGSHAFPLPIRMIMDLRFFVSFPKARHRPAAAPAVSVITQHLLAAESKVVVVALGPLTNLAEALLAAPQLASKISMLYIMGGALEVDGNLREMIRTDNAFAEWNIFIDPYAADVVLRSGAPITLVPLDATNQVPLTPEYYARLGAEAATPAARFVYGALRRIYPLLRNQKFYFWDPLAAVVATHTRVTSYRERCLRVVQDEGGECGRIVESRDGTTVRVCASINREMFERIFLDTLNARLGQWPGEQSG